MGGKNFGELKSICIGNVTEIVKLAKNLARCCNYQIRQFFTTNVFLLYGIELTKLERFNAQLYKVFFFCVQFDIEDSNSLL